MIPPALAKKRDELADIKSPIYVGTNALGAFVRNESEIAIFKLAFKKGFDECHALMSEEIEGCRAECDGLRELINKALELDTPLEFKNGEHIPRRHQAMAAFLKIALRDADAIRAKRSE